MNLGVVNSNKAAIRQGIVGAYFLQRLAEDCLNSGAYLLAVLNTLFPGRNIECSEIRSFIAVSSIIRKPGAGPCSGYMHSSRVGEEVMHDFPVHPVVIAGRAPVAGVGAGNVVSLKGNTRRIAEIWVTRGRVVDRGTLQELG